MIVEGSCFRHGVVPHYLDRGRPSCRLCNREKVAEHRRRQKLKAISYKGGVCCRCGASRSPPEMEFHHRDPEQKDFHISARGITRSWEKTKAELDKCDLVCGPCHRLIHSNVE